MSGRIYEMPVAPVSGDADRVVVMADRFGSTAESIRSASRSLRALDDGGSSSDAVDAFMAKAALLASQMGRAEERYEAAADALAAYARVLSVAQEAARRALREYGAAVDDHEVNHRQAEKFSGEALLEADELSKQWLQDQERLHRTRSDDARRRVIALGRVVDDAHAEVAAAATVAISRIDGASGDGLRDSVFDDIGGAVGAAYEGFQTWMENNDGWISVVIDVYNDAAPFLLLISALFPATAAVLAGVALAMTVLAVLRASAGTGTWLEAGIALTSLVSLGVSAGLSRSVVQSGRVLQAARQGQLIEAGFSPSLATGVVSKLWFRAQPRSFSGRYFGVTGSASAAQVSRFTRPSTIPAIVDDAESVIRIRRQLLAMRTLQGAELFASTGRTFDVSAGLQDRIETRPIPGASW